MRESGNIKRSLGAILFADVAGYSSLMADDEVGTHSAVRDHMRAFNDLCDHLGGEVLQVRGDGVFAVFGSVVQAVQFGIEVQKAVAEMNRDKPEDRRIKFRIGINLGEFIRDDLGVSGDSVNIAARIEDLSEDTPVEAQAGTKGDGEERDEPAP